MTNVETVNDLRAQFESRIEELVSEKGTDSKYVIGDSIKLRKGFANVYAIEIYGSGVVQDGGDQWNWGNLSLEELAELVDELEALEIEDPKHDYFQPKLTKDGVIVGHKDYSLYSNEVFKSKHKMMREYPYCVPVGFKTGSIKEPIFNDVVEPAEEEEDTFQSECYYKDPATCRGGTWECLTCHETYCDVHNHSTDKGDNVECVACERERKDNQNLEGKVKCCNQCGEPFTVSESGVATHVNSDGGIDYDADADHVPFTLEK